MSMVTDKSILFFFVIIMNLFVLSVSQGPQEWELYDCDLNRNFTINDAYQRNLDDALSSINSDTSITYGFYNRSVGQAPDQVYTIALCRGDVEQDYCRRCVYNTSTRLRGFCPNQKNGMLAYESCMVRYSNVIILGNPNTEINWNIPDPDAGNASNVDQFNQRLDQLWVELRTEASDGGPLRKYAANTTAGPRSMTIYGLVQCTPDLSKAQCLGCLDSAINGIRRCCDGKTGARVVYGSCNIRYQIYDFFNDTVALPSSPLPSSSQPPPPSSPSPSPPPSSQSGKSNNTTIIVAIAVVATVGLVTLIAVFVCVSKRRKRKLEGRPPTNSVYEDLAIDEIGTAESLQYSFDIIRAATNDFSEENKLGQGGFGLVYKGKLQNGKEIAVKRLSKDSGQGELEFKNEVLLLARLQHRNLVRLLGFILEGSERLLVYEYVKNASLDHIIFDPLKRATLDWERRYKIIQSVARGLVYLHEDSRLKIIHRDLKASNILLDAEMNAKIADFGMARLFTPEETQGNTSRVVGTYGYMAPEYLMHGQFSVKSDVFSFGVLVLEIVTGHKHHSFQDGMMVEDLLSHAWKSWRDGTVSSLIDPTLNDGSNSLLDMIRCIHIGLLCVQEEVTKRPTMTSVVLMLSSLSITLAVPSEPAFFMHTSTNPKDPLFEVYTSSTNDSSHSKSKSKSSQQSTLPDISTDDIYNR